MTVWATTFSWQYTHNYPSIGLNQIWLKAKDAMSCLRQEIFVLPHSFGIVVGKRLIEQKVSGLEGFNEDGYKRMVNWLIEMEELHDAMVY